jgi:ribose/xylose/arabinose/galactoside ABC-type transport system permease subunit
MSKEATTTKFKNFTKSQLFWPLVVLFLVLLSNAFSNPGFFKIVIKDGHLFGSIIDILKNGAPLMIIAVGMTFVIATGGIDISVGATVAIAGAVATSVMGSGSVSKIPFVLVILITLIVCLGLGIWNGMLVSVVGIQAVVATLILMVAGRGIAQLITDGQILTVDYSPYCFLGSGYFLGLPFAIFLVALVLIIALLIAKKTAFGLLLESTGVNRSSSKISGVKVKRIIFFVYVFCAICAGIAGLIISSNVKCSDCNNAGLFIELDAILSVALGGNSLSGGKFNLLGSIIGALIIQSLTTTIYSMGVSPNITFVVKAVVVVIICMVQSEAFRNLISGFINKKKGREIV